MGAGVSSAIVGKRSPEQGGEAALRPAGRLLPAGTRSAAAASPGGGGDNQAAAAVGRRRRRRASGPGVRNHSRPRRSGARGSRLPVKNVSHQRRPGTARGAGGERLPALSLSLFPAPSLPPAGEGGGRAGTCTFPRRRGGAVRGLLLPFSPPSLLPSPPPWGAAVHRSRDGGPLSRPGRPYL